MDEEFPRALCHQDDVDQRIMEFEQKFSTPVNADDMQEILASVHADHEECECDCCTAI